MNARVPALAVLAVLAGVAAASVGAQVLRPSAGAKRRQVSAARIDAAALYADRCAVCHGKKGEGTPMGRPLAAPLMNGETIEAITEILTTGVEGTPMVSFARTLSPAQIGALAKYVSAMKR